MPATRDTRTAQAAFVAHLNEVDELVKRIQAASANHLGIGPDEVNWGHVGNVGEIARLLRCAVNVIDGAPNA